MGVGWLTSHKECCWMFTRCCCEFVAVGCGCGLWCWADCWFLDVFGRCWIHAFYVSEVLLKKRVKHPSPQNRQEN